MLCKNEITKKITENYSLSSKKGCKTFRSKNLSKGNQEDLPKGTVYEEDGRLFVKT